MKILDVCCGSKMFWYDKQEPHTTYMDIRKAVYTTKDRKLRLSGSHRPVVKPDTDNYIKSTLDGLNGLLWEDDNQIVDLMAHKYYSDKPRVEIEVKKVCCIHKQ